MYQVWDWLHLVIWILIHTLHMLLRVSILCDWCGLWTQRVSYMVPSCKTTMYYLLQLAHFWRILDVSRGLHTRPLPQYSCFTRLAMEPWICTCLTHTRTALITRKWWNSGVIQLTTFLITSMGGDVSLEMGVCVCRSTGRVIWTVATWACLLRSHDLWQHM